VETKLQTIAKEIVKELEKFSENYHREVKTLNIIPETFNIIYKYCFG